MSKPLTVRVTPRNRKKEILVYGARDPRGYDNKITIELDREGKLRIKVMKVNLCYKFEQVIEETGFIEVVAV